MSIVVRALAGTGRKSDIAAASRGVLPDEGVSPFSLELSRIFMIAAWLGLLLVEVLNVFWGTGMLMAGPLRRRIVVALLFVLPTVGAVAAGLAMMDTALGSRRKINARGWFRKTTGAPRGAPPQSQEVSSKLDTIWHASSSAALLLYVGILIVACVAPLDLPDAASSNSSHEDLLGYSMPAVLLVTTLFGLRSRFIYVLLLYPLSIGYLARLEGGLNWDAVVPVTFLLTFNLTLVASLTFLYNRAGLLGRAVARLERRRLDEAQAQASHISRRRVDSYVHDNILSALTSVTAGVVAGKHLRQAATTALRSLESSDSVWQTTTIEDLFMSLEEEARLRDELMVTRSQIDRGAAQRIIPEEVCSAFRGVVAEAVTNSIQHARRSSGRRPVTRQLTLQARDDQIEVSVSDDGDSCDHGALLDSHAQRHGIRVSIKERMRDIGGHASVSCDPRSPEGGVEVRAVWSSSGLGELEQSDVLLTDNSVALSVQTWGARAVGIWAFIGTVIMILGQSSEYASLTFPFLALFWQGLVAVLLMWSWPNGEIPAWIMWFSVASVGLSNFLGLISIANAGYPSHAAWSLGTGWLLCILILLRAGPPRSWLAMVALGLSTWVWALLSGQSAAIAVELVAGQVIALFLWSLVALWSREILKATAQAEIQAREADAMRISTQTTTALLEQRLSGVSARARPVLESLQHADQVSSELRQSAALIEAELRDEIRAPSLCSGRLVEAARNARRRGLEIVLLDDSGSSLPNQRVIGEVVAMGIAALETAKQGRVVIRLMPPGREKSASIVTAQGAQMV